ncbi:MAG: PaaX family transcriptional regulator C-terminal domain-containing protein [Pseudomonadota bacterium]
MPSDPYAAARGALLDPANLRVWSMIATVFGDLALTKGAHIGGPVLSALMGEMDIRPEATRVALHRLRSKDAWITSEKAGRISQHSLTARGRRESLAAAKRIYAEPGAGADAWQVVLLESAGAEARIDMTRRGYAALAPRLFVGAVGAAPPEDALVLTPQDVPPWIGAQCEPKDLAHDYDALHERLARTAALGLEAATLSPLQTATLRCLIVHGWRRLVLRHPDLPRALYSDTWRGHDCHALVHALLQRLPRPSLADLDA